VSNTLSQPGYFPNPVSRENGLVTVTFGKNVVAGVAQVELRNSLGQLVWTKQVTLADGQSSMQIEMGDKLNTGMYHLSVRQNGAMDNYRILVE
jgi:methionine-rich copper-binding protein CopC